MNLHVHADALAEGVQAKEWFRQFSANTEREFSQALDSAIALVMESPSIGTPLGGGYRRWLLRRYRYAIVYHQDDTGITVVAVAHTSREPGYWRGRR